MNPLETAIDRLGAVLRVLSEEAPYGLEPSDVVWYIEQLTGVHKSLEGLTGGRGA